MGESEEKQTSRQSRTNFHLAGIIPVSAQPLDFGMPWNDALIPIGINYLAIERSVYECAYAGCETIWIVCNKETEPLMRRRIGDYVNDPTINRITLAGLPKVYMRLKQIPIYYVPVDLKDKERRMGLTHSILYGYKTIQRITKMFSRWATPSKFYVSFPHGVYTSSQLQQYRPLISSKKSVFLASPEGKTAKDGELLGFTFDSNEYPVYRKSFLDNENLLYKSGLARWENNRMVGREDLPIEERKSGRFIKIETLLENAVVTPENIIPIKWYYNISSWQLYCGFLSSSWARKVRRPKAFLRYKQFNKIGQDIQEETFETNEEMLDEDE